MWNNGTMAIKGRLYPTSIFELAANPGLGIFEDLREEFYPGIPNEPVTLVVVRPDMSDFQMTSTTDNEGFFEA